VRTSPVNPDARTPGRPDEPVHKPRVERNEPNGKPKYTAKIDLDFDGTGHFFCGRVAERNRGQLVFFDTILAGNLVSFFAAMAALYEAANYVGYVDVGAAVTGIEEGSTPYGLHLWGDVTFSGPIPGRTTRVSAAELRDDVKGVTIAPCRAPARGDEGPGVHPVRGRDGLTREATPL
jgi:hypothetical protein